MSSTNNSADAGTTSKLMAAVNVLTSLQQSGAGSTPVTDEHISAVGTLLSTAAAYVGQLAAAFPGRSAADIAEGAEVVDASVPTAESIVQDIEDIAGDVESFFASLTKPAAAATTSTGPADATDTTDTGSTS